MKTIRHSYVKALALAAATKAGKLTVRRVSAKCTDQLEQRLHQLLSALARRPNDGSPSWEAVAREVVAAYAARPRSILTREGRQAVVAAVEEYLLYEIGRAVAHHYRGRTLLELAPRRDLEV